MKGKQKTVSVYFAHRDSWIARALVVLARKHGIGESDLLKECFKEYCERVSLYRPPADENSKGQWLSTKIEKLELKYKPSRTKLDNKPIDDENGGD